MTTNDLKTKEQGRSMIEMLGVLAIIGVLSVGALSGYRMAMTQYRANEIVDYVIRVGEGALHHGTTQKTGSIPHEWNNSCPLYVNGEEVPFGINCQPYNDVYNDIPYLIVYLTNLPSPDVAAAVGARIGTNSNKAVYRRSLYTAGCPNMTFEQCGMQVFFKK